LTAFFAENAGEKVLKELKESIKIVEILEKFIKENNEWWKNDGV